MPEIVCGRSRQFITRVSYEDYDYLIRYLWTFAVSHPGGELIYIRRSVRVNGANVTVLMHRVVLERMGVERPSPRHTADHWDGDSLNNQRDNLRWATPREQMQTRRRIYVRRRNDQLAALDHAIATIPF